MRTLESFYKGPGWQRSGSDVSISNGGERDLSDATKQISEMLGEEGGLKQEAILNFAT